MKHLGLYEMKAARLAASKTHLQSSLSVLQDTLPTSHHTANCAFYFLIIFRFLCQSDCMCACHFYLATSFLVMEEASQASLHVEKRLEILKMISPVGHSKIGKGDKQVIHSFYSKQITLSFYFTSSRVSQTRNSRAE